MVFLLVESIWFWLFIVAFFVAEFFWVEAKESGVWATITLAAFIVALHFFSDLAMFSWIGDHPWHILGGIGAYFAIGSGWGFAKWFLFLKEKATEYQENRMNFLRDRGVKNPGMNTPVPEELRDDFQRRWGAREFQRPVAATNKARIIMWMSYWPWSALWTLVRDPFRYVYQAFAEKLESMSTKIFGDIGYEQDQEVPEKGAVAASGAKVSPRGGRRQFDDE